LSGLLPGNADESSPHALSQMAHQIGDSATCFLHDQHARGTASVHLRITSAKLQKKTCVIQEIFAYYSDCKHLLSTF
jgi:hypothetical protein